MVDEQQAGTGKSPSNRNLMIAAAVIAVAVVIVLAALLVAPGGRSDDHDSLVAGPISERILQASDLGSGWQVRNAFTNETGDSATGAYDVGTIILERHNASGGVSFIVQVWMMLYNTTENATSGYQSHIAEFATTSADTHPNPQQVNVGDGAMMYDSYRLTTGHDGKSLIFHERNVVCLIDYAIMSPQETLSEQTVIDLANKQIDKL